MENTLYKPVKKLELVILKMGFPHSTLVVKNPPSKKKKVKKTKINYQAMRKFILSCREVTWTAMPHCP